jgi:hypothetical protein
MDGVSKQLIFLAIWFSECIFLKSLYEFRGGYFYIYDNYIVNSDFEGKVCITVKVYMLHSSMLSLISIFSIWTSGTPILWNFIIYLDHFSKEPNLGPFIVMDAPLKKSVRVNLLHLDNGPRYMFEGKDSHIWYKSVYLYHVYAKDPSN